MKVLAQSLTVGDRVDGKEIVEISRGVGGLLVLTSWAERGRWYDNNQEVEKR